MASPQPIGLSQIIDGNFSPLTPELLASMSPEEITMHVMQLQECFVTARGFAKKERAAKEEAQTQLREVETAFLKYQESAVENHDRLYAQAKAAAKKLSVIGDAVELSKQARLGRGPVSQRYLAVDVNSQQYQTRYALLSTQGLTLSQLEDRVVVAGNNIEKFETKVAVAEKKLQENYIYLHIVEQLRDVKLEAERKKEELANTVAPIRVERARLEGIIRRITADAAASAAGISTAPRPPALQPRLELNAEAVTRTANKRPRVEDDEDEPPKDLYPTPSAPPPMNPGYSMFAPAPALSAPEASAPKRNYSFFGLF